MNKTNEVPLSSAGRKEGEVKRRRIPPAKSLADLAVDQKEKNPSKILKSEQNIGNDFQDDLKNEKSTPGTKTPVHEKQKVKKKKKKSKTDLNSKSEEKVEQVQDNLTDLNDKSKDKVAQIQDNLSSASPSLAKLREKSQSEINIAAPNIFVKTPSQVDHKNLESKSKDLKKMLSKDKSFSGTKIGFNEEENTYWPVEVNEDEENSNSYNHGFGFEKDEEVEPEIKGETKTASSHAKPARQNDDALALKENKQRVKSASQKFDQSPDKNFKLAHKSKSEYSQDHKKDLKVSNKKLLEENKKDVKFSNNYLLEDNKSSKQLVTEKISLESAKPSSYTNCARSKSKFSEVNTEDFEMSREGLSNVYVSQIVNKKGENEPFLIKAKENGNKNNNLPQNCKVTPPKTKYSEVHMEMENLGPKINLETAKPSSYTNCGHSKSKFSEVNTEDFVQCRERLSKVCVSEKNNSYYKVKPFLIKSENKCNKVDNDLGFIAQSCPQINNIFSKGQEIINTFFTNIEPYANTGNACKQLSQPRVNKCVSGVPNSERNELIGYLEKIERKLNLLSCEVESLKQNQNVYGAVRHSKEILTEIKQNNHSEKELQLLKYEFLFAPALYHNVPGFQENSCGIGVPQPNFSRNEFKETEQHNAKEVLQNQVSKIYVSQVRNQNGKVEPVFLEKKVVQESPVKINNSEMKTGKNPPEEMTAGRAPQRLIVSKRALKYKKKENVSFYPHQPVSTYIPDIRSPENEIIKINEVNWTETIEPKKTILKRKHSDLSIVTKPLDGKKFGDCEEACGEDSKDFFIGFC